MLRKTPQNKQRNNEKETKKGPNPYLKRSRENIFHILFCLTNNALIVDADRLSDRL
jgi:hypothetical protein